METPSKIQLIIVIIHYSLLDVESRFAVIFETKTNLMTALIMSADAMPIPTHIRLSPIKNAHKTNTAKGNKNWVMAKRTVLLPNLLPVTDVTNLESR